jgi:hypothetical protein
MEELQGAIDELKILWPTQSRSWEQKEASVTLKSHNLWFEVVPQLAYLGRFFHFMEVSISWKIRWKSCTSLISSPTRFIVTFGITSFKRSVSRNKRPLPDMLRFVNRWSKRSRITSLSSLLQPSQSEKARPKGPSLSRRSGGHNILCLDWKVSVRMTTIFSVIWAGQ